MPGRKKRPNVFTSPIIGTRLTPEMYRKVVKAARLYGSPAAVARIALHEFFLRHDVAKITAHSVESTQTAEVTS